VHLDSLHTIQRPPGRASELGFRVGVAVLIVLAAVLVLDSLGIVQLG
jgi:hypothetical protein